MLYGALYCSHIFTVSIARGFWSMDLQQESSSTGGPEKAESAGGCCLPSGVGPPRLHQQKETGMSSLSVQRLWIPASASLLSASSPNRSTGKIHVVLFMVNSRILTGLIHYVPILERWSLKVWWCLS